MYEKGATLEINKFKIYFVFQSQTPAYILSEVEGGNSQVTCPGCARIADGKWLPLILTCNVGPIGHFRSIARATIADTKMHRTIKAATKVARRAN